MLLNVTFSAGKAPAGTFCQPHRERAGVQVAACIIVDGTAMCAACFEGQSPPKNLFQKPGKKGSRTERLWDSAFARFVSEYGVTRLAKRLQISKTAVYHWIRGATSPRRTTAFILHDL